MNTSPTATIADQASAIITAEIDTVARFVRSRGTLLNLDTGTPPGQQIAEGIVAAAHAHNTIDDLKSAIQKGKALLEWDNRDVHYQIEDIHGLPSGKSGELAADITDAVYPANATLNHLRKRLIAAPEQARLYIADLLDMTRDQHAEIADSLKLRGRVQLSNIAESGAFLSPDALHHLLSALLAPDILPKYPIDQDLAQQRLESLGREVDILFATLTENGVKITPADAAYFTGKAHRALSLASAEHTIQLGNDIGEWDSRQIFSHIYQVPGIKGAIAQEDLSELVDRIETVIAPQRPTVTRLSLEIAANPDMAQLPIVSLIEPPAFKTIRKPLENMAVSTVGEFVKHAHKFHPIAKRTILLGIGRMLSGYTIPKQ